MDNNKKPVWVCMGVDRDAMNNGVNVAFTALPKNTIKQRLAAYLLDRGYVPLQDDESLADTVFNRYKTRRIERDFMSFVSMFREDFVFSSKCIGYIKNPTEEQLDTLVPETFQYTYGRTFREYFAGDPIEVGADKYYRMYCFYNDPNENGTYQNRDTDTNQDEFWAFYDYFGEASVVLQYEVDDLQNENI